MATFIYHGKEYASNHNKAGFVAIVGDKWQIGIGQDDSIKEYVKAHNGSMFRQFALVSAGQICEEQFALKGKVTRCALARKAGSTTIWYVETIHKESLYDFAQALADYGFTDAIYLTGGNMVTPSIAPHPIASAEWLIGRDTEITYLYLRKQNRNKLIGISNKKIKTHLYVSILKRV